MENRRLAYIVPHTHWDREWRYPIWKSRMMLVEFMDQLLKILDENGDYKQFLMDGQAVIIEDYLAMMPENKEKLYSYIKEGRIAVGPWYTLPDLYPVDGECLVRNLLKGKRVADEMGGCLKIGYTSFGWGQTAQFPQIYAGFGIDFIVTAKLITKKRSPKDEFIWEAPDGTKVLTTRLGNGGRHNFFVNSYIPAKYGVNINNSSFKYQWGKTGISYHKANEEAAFEDYFKLDDHSHYFPDTVKDTFESCWKATDDTTVDNVRLIPAGCDFTGPLPELKDMIKDANETIHNKEFVHGTIQEYVNQFKQLVNRDELLIVKGELREGPSYACSSNALATRIYIKQLNKKVQNILIHKAEPLSALIAMFGGKYPVTFLTKAWDYLLKAHPHDSINGVTQDKTVEDNMYRLNQAYEISNVVYERGLSDLMLCMNLTSFNEEDLLLTAVNMLPLSISDVVKVCVDIPREYNAWDFKVFDDLGHEVEIQSITKQEKVSPVNDLHSRPWPFYVDRHTFYLDTGIIPACGYKVFKVVPTNTFKRDVEGYPQYMRMTDGQCISKAHNMLENEFLKVEAASNGTFKIEDKQSGKVYKNLHHFEDTGEVGDYWISVPAYKNQTYTSHGLQANIWCEDNGRLSATLGIKMNMEIPKYSFRPDNFFNSESKRSDEKTQMTITTYITLKKGSKKLEVKLKVDNTAEDHRLRVMYPTGIQPEYSYAAGHFTVDKRPVLPKEGETELYYPEMQTLPQQYFVDVSDEAQGIAFVNNSLTEFELKNDGYGTLALTLFRSVRNIICTETRAPGRFPDQKGGQCLGLREYEYAIYPHTGNWEKGSVYSEARQFNVPVTVMQVTAHKKGTLPSGIGLFEIQPENLILSAFKKAEDRNGFIIRLFNPTDKSLEGSLKLYKEIQEAYSVNLNEERGAQIDINNAHEISISVPSNKIMTIELVI